MSSLKEDRQRKQTHRQRRQTHRNEGHVNTEADAGVALPQAKNTRSHRRPGEARKDPPLEPLEGAAGALVWGFWSLELRENTFL